MACIQTLEAAGAAGLTLVCACSGGLFVAAAGNDGTNNDKEPLYPGSYNLPCILAVTSTTKTDRKSDFGNYGA